MKLLVRCIRNKMGEGKLLLQAGLVYEAIKNEEKVSVTNHYNEVVEMDLKEFNYRCKIVKKIV